jgi:hypothetical protein
MTDSVARMIEQGVDPISARQIALRWQQREAKGQFVCKGFWYRMKLPGEKYTHSGDMKLIDAW